jgi:hypothetical protein
LAQVCNIHAVTLSLNGSVSLSELHASYFVRLNRDAGYANRS